MSNITKQDIAKKKTKKTTKKKKTSKIEESLDDTQKAMPKEEAEQPLELILPEELFAPPPAKEKPELRAVGLYGDVEEESARETIFGLLSMLHTGRHDIHDDKGEVTGEAVKPVELILSTNGGSAPEMFSIYDTMRYLQDKGCEVHTVGLGKVMSAGVVILASGTKGQRKIGANTRVMIHNVIGAHGGSLPNLENEMDEVRLTQDKYVSVLAKETKLNKAQIKKMLKKKINIYLSAEEAVKYGIADIII